MLPRPIPARTLIRRPALSRARRAPASTSTTPKPPSPHITFYQSHGRPIAKVFLGALFTYQVLYWAWARMEVDEVRERKEEEIRSLEATLADATAKRDEAQKGGSEG